jgi:hypothetical protein
LQNITNFIDNCENLIELKLFLDTIKEDGVCHALLPQNSYYPDLERICDQDQIFKTDYLTLSAFLISKIRENYISFAGSNKAKDKIIKYFHSSTIQLVNFVYLIFFKNFFQITKYTYGSHIYLNDISRLVFFSIILFIIIVVTEFTNFIIIRIKVVNKLSAITENFSILEKFFFNDVLIE